MIQLSLRTGMRREAYILARKLTAESDRMYDDMSRNLVSVGDARAFLSHVINDELARMRKVALVTRMDPEHDVSAYFQGDEPSADLNRLQGNRGISDHRPFHCNRQRHKRSAQKPRPCEATRPPEDPPAEPEGLGAQNAANPKADGQPSHAAG
jgi:hypothetical protein